MFRLRPFLLLFLFLLLPLSLPFARPLAAQGGAWQTYSNSAQGYSLRYPAAWFLYPDTQDGRYPGLNGALLANFAVHFQNPGADLSFPPSGAAAILRLEGHLDGDLLAHARAHLRSPEYDLSGRVLTFGSHQAVELTGHTGRLFLLALGPNLYSLTLFAANDPASTLIFDQVIASLEPTSSQPIPLPPSVRALDGMERPSLAQPLSSPSPTFLNPLPFFRLPWDASAGYSMTGGPHNGVSLVPCAQVTLSGATGLDFGMSYNEVLAVADGSLEDKGYASGSIGNYVIVNHGGGWSTRYWHLSQVDPQIASLPNGTPLAVGRLLGVSGTAGSGPHLHLELRYNDLSSGITWHGGVLDGYTARALLLQSNQSLVLNYQGTLTIGGDASGSLNYAPCSNTSVVEWTGLAGTIEAGDPRGLASSNHRTTTAASSCAYNANQLVILANPGFSGTCKTLAIGDYPDANAMGFPNDEAGSLKLGNLQAVLCRDVGYGGGCLTLTSDSADLSLTPLGGGQLSSLHVQPRTSPPAPPAFTSPLSGTVVTEGALMNLSWAPTGVQYFGEVWGGPAVTTTLGWQTAPPATLPALTAGYTYTWHIKANNAFGESPWNASSSFVLKPAAPTSLTGLAPSCNSISLAWHDNSAAESGFKIYRDSTVVGQVLTNTVTFRDPGITGLHPYSYSITAFRNGVESDPSNTVSFTTPRCPLSLPILLR